MHPPPSPLFETVSACQATQVFTDPMTPLAHRQLEEPSAFAQNASPGQLPLLMAHSLMSEHDVPGPSYPAWHSQRTVPGTLIQFAFGSHPPLLTRHSFLSEQLNPSPA